MQPQAHAQTTQEVSPTQAPPQPSLSNVKRYQSLGGRLRNRRGLLLLATLLLRLHILAQSPGRVSPSLCPYSPECVEGVFSEVHMQDAA